MSDGCVAWSYLLFELGEFLLFLLQIALVLLQVSTEPNDDLVGFVQIPFQLQHLLHFQLNGLFVLFLEASVDMQHYTSRPRESLTIRYQVP